MKSADSNQKYLTRDQYIELWNQTREAYLALIDTLTDADLDADGPEQFRAMFPTVGKLMNMSGLHTMQHAGQFVATRRLLKKPIAF